MQTKSRLYELSEIIIAYLTPRYNNVQEQLSDLLNGRDYRTGEPSPWTLECIALYYIVARGGRGLTRVGVN